MTNTDHPVNLLRARTGPKSLHGRDEERQYLQSVFDRIEATGTTEVVMLEGRGGVGKSTLVRWLLKRAQGAGCMIGEGKCEQLNAEVPFASVAQIVQMLTLDALGSEQAVLDGLAARWRDLLSGHASAIIELVPAAAHVLGGSGSAFSPLESRGHVRIEQAILRTFEAFSALGRPSVIFLDDLHWADEATLSLLKSFMLNPPRNVLLIGACRDDVAFSTWYAQARHATRHAAANFSEMTLAPLSLEAFGHIVADALGQSDERLDSLARVLYEKSGGNPYFAQQLLQTWIDDGALAQVGSAWHWIEDEVQSSSYADHVVDLIIQRISKLPDPQKLVLRTLACIGGHCEKNLLAFVCGMDAVAFASVIDQLMNNGLLVRRGASCALQHDRVLEAAYVLIAPEARSAAHADVARRMAFHAQDRIEAAAYDIGNQIEKIAPADMLDDEKPGFVRILALAARRAQRASAIDRAYNYIRTANSMMDPAWWETHFALAYEAALIECECLIAKGKLTLASDCIGGILAHALSTTERAPLHRLEAVLYTLQSNYEQAIDAALAGLDILDVALKRQPDPAEMYAAYSAVMHALDGKEIRQLAALPVCEDERIKSAMALLSTLISSFFIDDNIKFTHLAKLVELTLHHGVSPDSPYGLAWFGVFIANHYDAFVDGYDFGVAALAMVDRHGFESTRTATLVALDQVAVWTQPLDVALDYALRASRHGRLSGDIGMACYACNHIVSDMLAMGTVLPLVEDAAQHGIDLTRTIGYLDIELLIASQLDFVRSLTTGVMADGQARWIAACQARAASAKSLPTKFWALLYAGMAAVFHGQWAVGLAFLRQSMAEITAVPAHINVADCHLFHALALSREGKESPELVIPLLTAEISRFALWTSHNPRTFENKLQLLQGELARREGDYLAALRYFEQSACSASTAGFVHEQAFAHEMAALVCAEQSLAIAASHHAQLAKTAYGRWGAHYKADSMAVVSVFQKEAAQREDADDRDRNDSSALQFGLKTAHALSQGSLKEKLVETMFSDLLEHANAQYGLLVRVTDEVQTIEASGRATKGGIVTSITAVEPTEGIVPLKLLNTVLRTRQSIIIHDAVNDASALHLQREQGDIVRSALCLPLMRADELVGLLYLENNTAPNVFNPARVLRLELMASQIAIALGFARLYEQLILANAARTEVESKLHTARAELVRNAHASVLANLAASIAHEINQPLGAIVIAADATLRWLNREEPNIERVQEGLQRIKIDGLRAADIIRALRGLAKKNAVQLAEVLISDIIADVVHMLSDDFASHDIHVDLDLEPDMIVMGDKVQLQQLILNLLKNAIEAMIGCTEQRDHRLAVRAHVADARLKMIIQDNGPGISSENMENIFEPFYTTKGNGLGMGLAICASVAEVHGGTLSAVNIKPRGTSFIVDIPACIAESESD